VNESVDDELTAALAVVILAMRDFSRHSILNFCCVLSFSFTVCADLFNTQQHHPQVFLEDSTLKYTVALLMTW